ncbi:MAG: TetR/AcrR family transcriptional regulator [Bryobacteraceae bacterium]
MLRVSTSICYEWKVPAQRPYHHGNLREVLLAAGVELIAEVGPAGFTLREAARRAGVSHNAPYRHFRDKDELLAAVAAQGFDELTASMRSAAGKQKTALDRLRSAGLAYIEFALRRPQHFTVMFDVPGADTGNPAHEAGVRSFQTLVGLIEECQAEGFLAHGDPMQLARIAWSLVHGVAKLAVAGRFPGWSRAKILEFGAAAMNASFRGLVAKP